KLLMWVTVLVIIMACVPALGTPVVPTMDPGVIGTFIAQTVNAAATQTAAVVPSSTLTPSLTPTRNTETPSPTATSTVIFILSSPTPVILPTLTNVSLGGSGSSSDNYACQVTRVNPPNGSAFDPRGDFDVFWTVRNIGQRNWNRSDVDYIYSSGAKFHEISGYDLEDNVRVGNSVDLGVDMQAPKDSGTYSTTWTMRIGERTFCPMSFTIVVR
ncbi:MAG: NBR1-Ig-like domain-containing protein, partial [Anaerolineales bacterium]